MKNIRRIVIISLVLGAIMLINAELGSAKDVVNTQAKEFYRYVPDPITLKGPYTQQLGLCVASNKDLKIPDKADICWKTLNKDLNPDNIMTMGELKGKVVLLRFFRESGNPYDKSLDGFKVKPLYDKYYKDNPNVAFLSIEITEFYVGKTFIPASPEQIKKNYIMNYEWPFLIGGLSSVPDDYGGGTTPHTVIIDYQGKIRYEHSGDIEEGYDGNGNYVEGYFKQFKNEIDGLLAEMPPAPIIPVPVPAGHAINTKPAVDKGRVFFGSDDKKIYALDEYTGSKLWEFATGGMVKSSPTVSDGMVFVGSDDGKIYALDEFSGEKKWEFMTGDAVKSSPTVSDGVVFVGSDDGKVYALNAYNGIQIWSYTTGGAVRTKPAVHDYRVFVGSMDKKVYTIDRYDGTLIRSYATAGIILSSPAVAYNRIFVGSNDYNFYSLDEDNSEVAWKYDAGGQILSSPVIDKGMLFFGSVNNKIHALSAGIFPAHENPANDTRIKIEGVIDRYQTNTGFYGETVIGEINITLDPDILGSFVLSAECAFLMYTSQIYPAEHKLIAKESSAGDLGKNYGYSESYGYELTEFNYLEQCRKTCPLACNCYVTTTTIPAEDWNRLLPNCTEFSEEGEEINRIRTDCACLPDWCYPEQCKSTRTFHEDEGSTIANGDFENGLYSWNIVSGTATTEFGGISGYKLKLRGNITQEIPSLSTNPNDKICLDYWINDSNPGSFKLTARVDGTPNEFMVYNGAPSCGIPAGWDKFCTPAINGIISRVNLSSSLEVFVDNVNLGRYYDFVDLKTFSLEDVEIMDEKISPKNSFGGISFDDITHQGNTYTLKFSTTQLPYTVFEDANITLITHFRNITVKLFPASADVRENPYVNVKLKKPTKIFVQKVDPGKYNLKPGTQVTIYLKAIDLETNEPLVNEKVIAIDEKTGEEEVLITDSNGETTFTTTVGDFIKTIIFIKVASAKASGAETKESLNPYKTRSPLLSVEFFVLIIIFLLAVFAYRWFRKGRMDFYEMWEEIRGKK